MMMMMMIDLKKGELKHMERGLTRIYHAKPSSLLRTYKNINLGRNPYAALFSQCTPIELCKIVHSSMTLLCGDCSYVLSYGTFRPSLKILRTDSALGKFSSLLLWQTDFLGRGQ